jgi:hypothetical protein
MTAGMHLSRTCGRRLGTIGLLFACFSLCSVKFQWVDCHFCQWHKRVPVPSVAGEAGMCARMREVACTRYIARIPSLRPVS